MLLANHGHPAPLAAADLRRVAVIGPNAARPVHPGRRRGPHRRPIRGLSPSRACERRCRGRRGRPRTRPRHRPLPAAADPDGPDGPGRRSGLDGRVVARPGAGSARPVSRYNVHVEHASHVRRPARRSAPERLLRPACRRGSRRRLAVRTDSDARPRRPAPLRGRQASPPTIGTPRPAWTFRRPCSRARSDGATFELEAGKPVLIPAEAHSATHEPSLLAVGCAAPAPVDPMALLSPRPPRRTSRSWWWATTRPGRARAATARPSRCRVARTSWSSESPPRTTRTIVVVNAGCPMDLPWADEVAARHLRLAARTGVRPRAGRRPARRRRAGRPAAASPSPAGRPTTRLRHDARTERGTRVREGVDRRLSRLRRGGIEPRFAFGHGLGLHHVRIRDRWTRVGGPRPGRAPRTASQAPQHGPRALARRSSRSTSPDLQCSVPRAASAS